IAARHQGEARLGATESGPAMVVLSETPGALAPSAPAIGLYHFAIRYPTRADLAAALKKLARQEYPIQGASDHLVSEAIYLSDPDGNGIELYADRPRSQWVWREGQIVMATEPLDLDNLVASADAPRVELQPRTELGHIHLRVANLAAAERFYHEF